MLPEDNLWILYVNITQPFRWLGVPFTVIFPHAAC